jgi:glycosyltransferase involved in cell wall biosynthesis
VYNYLCRRFREHGWEFKVVSDCLQPQNKLPVLFDFQEIPFSFWKYSRLINAMRPDAVILYLHLKDVILWPLIHWLKLKRTPIIFWTKGANLDEPESKLRYNLFNYIHGLSDALVLYSGAQIGFIKAKHRHKVFVANNTINYEDFPEVKESKEQIKAEFGILFHKVVLFVGTMGVGGERKKAEHLIQVFEEIDRSDIGLLIVGSGMPEALKSRINPKNSRYLGEIHDPQDLQISKLFKAADLFVVPGHVGLGLNQAFYWGLPVVTEQGRQPPEIQYLQPGRNGFIVPENDVAALKEKMLYLLDNDTVRREFARHAREDILRHASIEDMFQGFRRGVEFAFATKAMGKRWRMEWKQKRADE